LALLTAPAAKDRAVKGSIIVNLYPPVACVIWGYCPDTVVPPTVHRGITGVVALLVEPAASAIDERMGVPNEHQCTEHQLFVSHLLDSTANVLDVFVDTGHADCLTLYHHLDFVHTLRESYELLSVLLDVCHHHADCPYYSSCLCHKAKEKRGGDTFGYVPTVFCFRH